MNRHNNPRWRRYSRSRARHERLWSQKHECSKKARNLRKSPKKTKRVREGVPFEPFFNPVSAQSPLSLFTNFEQTNAFFKKLEGAFKKHTEVYIDIQEVQEIEIESILVLLALIKRYTKNRTNLKIRGNSPKAGTQAAQILYDSGYYEEFRSIYPHRNPSGRVCRMISKKGFKIDPIMASEMALDAGEEIFGLRDYPLGVYPTLIEAMGNTREHAEPNVDAAVRWWTMFFVDKANKRACFIIYDGGVGILGSLRSRLSKWFTLFNAPDEDVLHDLMIGKQQSRTRLPYRGKGLPAMARAVERGQIHNLKILSNRAMGDISANHYQKLPSDFRGTMLYWEVLKP